MSQDGTTPDDPLLDLVLAGTPERVTDVFVPDPALQGRLAEHKRTLASLAYALPVVPPPDALRVRVRARLEQMQPRTTRRALIVMDMSARASRPAPPPWPA